VLDPVTFDPGRPRRGDSPGGEPRRSQIAFLAEIGAEDPHLEVLPLNTPEPALHYTEGRIDRNGLVRVRRRAGPERTGVGSILPEERPNPPPVSLRETAGVAAEQMLDGILVAAATSRSTVFDAAPGNCQEAEPECREL